MTWKDFIIQFVIITIIGGTISGLLVEFIIKRKSKQNRDSLPFEPPSTQPSNRKKIILFPITHTKNKGSNNKEKLKKLVWIVIGGIGSAFMIIPILVVLSSNNKETGVTKQPQDAPKEVDAYFISVAVSDTISNNFEPAKKIVVTASDDTDNMTLTGELSTQVFGPFNMTMESSRRFSFIAVFDQSDEYIITITAVSKDKEVVTEKISIEAQADFEISMPD